MNKRVLSLCLALCLILSAPALAVGPEDGIADLFDLITAEDGPAPAEAPAPEEETPAPVEEAAPAQEPASAGEPAHAEEPAAEETDVSAVEAAIAEEPAAAVPVTEEPYEAGDLSAGGERVLEGGSVETSVRFENEVAVPAQGLRSTVDVVRVSVPSTGRIVTNPYGLDVAVDGKVTNRQVIAEPVMFYSESRVPVSVTARAVGEPDEGSAVNLVTADIRVREEGKDVFLWFEFQNAPDGSGKGLEWSEEYRGRSSQIVVNQGRSEVLTIPAAGPDAPSYAAFRANGSMSAAPREPWTAADTVTVTVAFTFDPILERE